MGAFSFLFMLDHFQGQPIYAPSLGDPNLYQDQGPVWIRGQQVHFVCRLLVPYKKNGYKSYPHTEHMLEEFSNVGILGERQQLAICVAGNALLPALSYGTLDWNALRLEVYTAYKDYCKQGSGIIQQIVREPWNDSTTFHFEIYP